MNKRKSSYVLCTLCNIDKTCDRVIKLANQSSNFVVLHVGMLVATLEIYWIYCLTRLKRLSAIKFTASACYQREDTLQFSCEYN